MNLGRQTAGVAAVDRPRVIPAAVTGVAGAGPVTDGAAGRVADPIAGVRGGRVARRGITAMAMVMKALAQFNRLATMTRAAMPQDTCRRITAPDRQNRLEKIFPSEASSALVDGAFTFSSEVGFVAPRTLVDFRPRPLRTGATAGIPFTLTLPSESVQPGSLAWEGCDGAATLGLWPVRQGGGPRRGRVDHRKKLAPTPPAHRGRLACERPRGG